MSRLFPLIVTGLVLWQAWDIAERLYEMNRPKRLAGPEYTYTALPDGAIGVKIDFAASGHHYGFTLPSGEVR